MRGLSERAKARIKTSYLIDSFKMETLAGRVNGIPAWSTLVDLDSCLLLLQSGRTFLKDGTSGGYDALLVCMAETTFDQPDARYRATVTKYKSRLEKSNPDGEPEIKKVYVFEIENSVSTRDVVGTEFLQTLKCISGVPA